MAHVWPLEFDWKWGILSSLWRWVKMWNAIRPDSISSLKERKGKFLLLWYRNEAFSCSRQIKAITKLQIWISPWYAINPAYESSVLGTTWNRWFKLMISLWSWCVERKVHVYIWNENKTKLWSTHLYFHSSLALPTSKSPFLSRFQCFKEYAGILLSLWR